VHPDSAAAQDTRSADGATTLLQQVAARVALAGDELPALAAPELRVSLTVRGCSPHWRYPSQSYLT